MDFLLTQRIKGLKRTGKLARFGFSGYYVTNGSVFRAADQAKAESQMPVLVFLLKSAQTGADADRIGKDCSALFYFRASLFDTRHDNFS